MNAPAAATSGQLDLLHIHVHWHEHDATVTLDGELDYATAPALSAQLTEILARKPHRLILDMATLAFIDCGGITPIARARGVLLPGRSLILRSPTPAARKLFKITGIDQICDLQST